MCRLRRVAIEWCFPRSWCRRGTPTIGASSSSVTAVAWSTASPDASSHRGVRPRYRPAPERCSDRGTSHAIMGRTRPRQTGDRAVAEQALRRPHAVRDALTPSVATRHPGQRAAIMIRRPATSRRAPNHQPARPPSRDRRLPALATSASCHVRGISRGRRSAARSRSRASPRSAPRRATSSSERARQHDARSRKHECIARPGGRRVTLSTRAGAARADACASTAPRGCCRGVQGPVLKAMVGSRVRPQPRYCLDWSVVFASTRSTRTDPLGGRESTATRR